MTRNTAFISLLLFGASFALAQVVTPGDEAKKLHALFDEDWQWGLKQFPEMATLLGDDRYNDRLTDYSPEALARNKAHDREMLDRIQKIDRAKLAGQDVISYDLFLRDKRLSVEGARFPTELMPVDQMNGVQILFGQLVGSTPFRNAKDYADYLARLAALPRQIDQLIALMRRGIASGWVQPAVPLRSLPAQIEGQIAADPAASPAFAPFKNFPADLPAAERMRLVAAGRQAVNDSFTPAMQKLLAFVKNDYLPAARKDIGASSLPDGAAYYQHSIRRHTTTDLTAKEIHEIGVREVARIRGEMEAIIRGVGFKRTFQEFLTFLRTDPRFYYGSADDLIAGYALIAKRADGELPKLFAELPRNSYGIRVIPDYEAPAQTTAYYQPGASGARAGIYMINTYKLDTRPRYEMEALTLHESVPGHHLQISRAQELKGLPEFRRNAGYTAYVEGWALYAESLGGEMGFYADPYSKFGQLTYEMWRACRLVVDTGMHAMGWTREQAINFMKANTAKTENDIVVEVDRYIVWPGQALAYKLGELKIKELRARAARELGARFDVRKFHNAILDDGPLPLDLLDRRLSDWIAAEKRKE
ncbi:MAG TPA: DUF885 domain-containing protein [Blastocatellia bacterium]|nr:DUF885 domain-containing protein [Blastocatellia bacterium]